MFDRWNALLKKYSAVAQWLLVLITVAVFRGMLANGFVYDDGRQVLENPFVRNPRLWRNIFTGSVWSFLGQAAETNFYRPLHIFSHWLVWQVAGADPGAFHLYQLVIYVICVLLVFRLGLELSGNHLVAIAGALLWTLHPLHVEPVCWIAGVPDCGTGLFYILAFVIFLRAERAARHHWAWHLLAAVAFFVALLFKEMAISFPIMVLAYWFVFADREAWWRKALRWIPYVVVAGIYLELRNLTLGHLSRTQHLWKVTPRVAAAATGLLGQHTKLFFWPTDLNDFRSFDLTSGLHSIWPYATLAVLGLAIILRRRDPTLCFLVLWWPVALIPCLDVRQLSFPLLAERFTFLPSMGLAMAAAYFILKTIPASFPNLKPERVLVPALAVWMALLTVQDVRAVVRWRDNQALWNYSYQVAPQSALVHVHRALELEYRYNDLPAATREYEMAIQLNHAAFVELPTVTYDCLIGLGQIENVKGHTDQALVYFEKAVALIPRYSPAYDSLGSVYFPRGDYARAAEYFERAIKANPMDLSARFFLGTSLMKLGKPAQAVEQFRAAREVDPGYGQAYEAEAQALTAAGDSAGAARVRAMKPTD